jgi:hypothetical protein
MMANDSAGAAMAARAVPRSECRHYNRQQAGIGKCYNDHSPASGAPAPTLDKFEILKRLRSNILRSATPRAGRCQHAVEERFWHGGCNKALPSREGHIFSEERDE